MLGGNDWEFHGRLFKAAGHKHRNTLIIIGPTHDDDEDDDGWNSSTIHKMSANFSHLEQKLITVHGALLLLDCTPKSSNTHGGGVAQRSDHAGGDDDEG